MEEEQEFADLPGGDPPPGAAPGQAIQHAAYIVLADYLREHGEEPAWELDFGPEVDEEIKEFMQGAVPTLNQLFRAPAGHTAGEPFRPWVTHLLTKMAEESISTMVLMDRIDLSADEL